MANNEHMWRLYRHQPTVCLAFILCSCENKPVNSCFRFHLWQTRFAITIDNWTNSRLNNVVRSTEMFSSLVQNQLHVNVQENTMNLTSNGLIWYFTASCVDISWTHVCVVEIVLLVHSDGGTRRFDESSFLSSHSWHVLGNCLTRMLIYFLLLFRLLIYFLQRVRDDWMSFSFKYVALWIVHSSSSTSTHSWTGHSYRLTVMIRIRSFDWRSFTSMHDDRNGANTFE
jgi:hypothetical protein